MGIRLLEEPEESPDDEDFEGLDANPNLGLGEEPGSLLNYLRVRQDLVMKSCLHSMPGLPLYKEISIHNSLIFQLERELTCHQSEGNELMDIASKWIDDGPRRGRS